MPQWHAHALAARACEWCKAQPCTSSCAKKHYIRGLEKRVWGTHIGVTPFLAHCPPNGLYQLATVSCTDDKHSTNKVHTPLRDFKVMA
eukprot:2049478-Amphidinium_carterae.1